MQTLETHTLESQPQSNNAALSGLPFENLNFQAIIEAVASRKSANGHTISLVNRKGKATLFSGVAAACKSQSGINFLDSLTDEQVATINREIATFWRNQTDSLLSEGYEQVGLKKHMPAMDLDLPDRKVTRVYWKATATYNKQAGKDAKLVAMLKLASLQKQQAIMRESLAKYTRADHAEMDVKIEVVENYIKQLETPVAPTPKE
jgi:hypothetical protein